MFVCRHGNLSVLLCVLWEQEEGSESASLASIKIILNMWKLLEDAPFAFQTSTSKDDLHDMFDEQNLPTLHHLTVCADNLHEAVYETAVHLLLVSLKSIAVNGCPKHFKETCKPLLMSIIRLGRPDTFLDHVRQVLVALEEGGGCKWWLLLDIIGSFADGADVDSYASALNTAAMEIKVVSSFVHNFISRPKCLLLRPWQWCQTQS